MRNAEANTVDSGKYEHQQISLHYPAHVTFRNHLLFKSLRFKNIFKALRDAPALLPGATSIGTALTASETKTHK